MELIEIVKNKKRENILLDIIVTIFCIINLLVLNKYNKYMEIDVSNRKLMQYKFENLANIYEINLDGKKTLVLLNENTKLGKNIYVKKIKDNKELKEIKQKLGNNFSSITLSNIDYDLDIKVEKYKLYTIVCIAFISIISLIVNLYGITKPEKTKYYKKISSKYYN